MPYVSDVPDMTAEKYVDLIASRFSNTEIRDTTRRVAFDGSSRHPEFILPILRDALDKNGSIEGLALVEALWARMCAGTREDGTLIKDNDPNWRQISTIAQESAHEPTIWLKQRQIYGDLPDNPMFSTTFGRWLQMIWSKGSVAALQTYLSNSENMEPETTE